MRSGVNHRKDNVKKNYGKKHVSAYLYCVRATSMDELEARKRAYAQLPRAAEFVPYMSDLPDHAQYPIAHKLHVGPNLRGNHSEQPCESMNASIYALRQATPSQALMKLAQQDHARACELQADALGHDQSPHALVPAVRRYIFGTDDMKACESGAWQQLKTDRAKSGALRQCRTERGEYRYARRGAREDNKGIVTVARDAGPVHLDVDLNAKTCACGWWERDGFPCRHALGYAHSTCHHLCLILPEDRTVAHWHKQWATVQLSGSLTSLPEYRNYPHLCILEAQVPNKAGRPKKRTERLSSVAKDWLKG